MPSEPQIASFFFNKKQQRVNLWQLSNIVGTVLDKDKIRHTITLLDNSGVFTVKLYRQQFSKFDKQISEQLDDNHRKIMEKSWFTRGNIVLIQGYRRGSQFIPKAYKDSYFEKPIKKVIDINENNDLVIVHERYGEG